MIDRRSNDLQLALRFDDSASDERVRAEALDPCRSFLVHAPAGSGKTELLIRRFLRLLAIAHDPREIVAITFTRKAVAELHARTFDALMAADRGEIPGDDAARTRFELARRVLARSVEKGWRLLENPGQLQIKTIDALCLDIAGRAPWSARGVLGDPDETPDEAYLTAARRTLSRLELDGVEGTAVETLLQHRDNDVPAVEALIIEMLARRDQWLDLLHACKEDSQRLRQRIEDNLAAVTRRHLQLLSMLAQPFGEELVVWAAYAAGNLEQRFEDLPLNRCRDLDRLPGYGVEDLELWKGIAAFCLTDKGDLRMALQARHGFPPKKPGCRQNQSECLAFLRSLPSQFLEALHQTRKLPPFAFTDDQWAVMEALVVALPAGVKELSAVFARTGRCDFIEIALAALNALGTERDPTDLGLALGWKIQHLLVDEYQDTSLVQDRLLRRLTSNWDGEQGQTVFFVGDPMQSIYRFRQAEVRLFIDIQRSGRFGALPVTALQLTSNFRSSPQIVQWNNRAFTEVFNNDANDDYDAIEYAPAFSPNAEALGSGVRTVCFPQGDDETEPAAVCRIIHDVRRRLPDASIAILVRARSHLAEILPALREAEIEFQSVKIDTLAGRQIIRDLFALTRALIHPADRLAWLSILRAPWCGLQLADLLALTEGAQGTIPDLLPERLPALSDNGRARAKALVNVLNAAGERWGRVPLRQLVESTWLTLGGAACQLSDDDFSAAQAYFDLLDEQTRNGEIPEIARLEARLEILYAQPRPASTGAVQVMTIHEAKGLEWDVVIVPALEKKAAQNPPTLLRYVDVRDGNERQLLIAPVSAKGETDPIYKYIDRIDQERDRQETRRVLYVACTRAKHELYLSAQAVDRNGQWQPQFTDSFLTLLWPTIGDDFANCSAPSSAVQRHAPADFPLLRLPADCQIPDPLPGVEWTPAEARSVEKPISFDWVRERLRIIGSVVHVFVQKIALDGLAGWSSERVRSQRPQILAALLARGISEGESADAVTQVEGALIRTLKDERGRWILGSREGAQTEYALAGEIGGGIRHIQIDRTFVAEGERWIVDFKTSQHRGSGLDKFLDNEVERYREQLNTYARLMRQMESRTIRLGLYFPLLSAWREWQYEGEAKGVGTS